MSSEFKPSNSIALYDVSGNAAVIKSGVGLNTINTADNLTTSFIQCSSGSGGVALSANTSSYSFGIIVKNVSNVMGVSGVIRLGSSGTPPYISGGYALGVGESVTLNANRADFIRVYGMISGVGVSWLALSK